MSDTESLPYITETGLQSPDFTPETRISMYKALLQKYGVEDTESIRDLFFERMDLLSETGTVEDEITAVHYAEKIFEFCRESGSPNAVSPEEEKHVDVSTLLTDIGKTGPAEASPEQVQFIADMYAIRDNFNIHNVSVAQFLQKAHDGGFTRKDLFSEDVEVYLELARSLDIHPYMTMRAFYNLHVGWTLDILQKSGLPAEASLTAASHHILEGQNPQNIINLETGSFQAFGVDREVDQREVWVILLDKYDAARHRDPDPAKRKDHKQAIAWLKNFVNHPQADRPFNLPGVEALPERLRALFHSCLDDMDKALEGLGEQQSTPGMVAA